MAEPPTPSSRPELSESMAAGHDATGSRPAQTGGASAAALAVAALAVGVLACGFSWMFFIRTWIVIAGAVAVALGLAGVMVARRGGQSTQLAVAGAVLGVLSVVVVFATEAVVRNYVTGRLGALVSDVNGAPGATTNPSAPAFPSDTVAPTSDVPLPGAASADPAGGTPPPASGDVAATNVDAPLPVGR